MPIVVGIPACTRLFNERLLHATPARYAEALTSGSDALSIMIPPMGETQLALLDRIDGLLIPGSASNVHPSHYGTNQSLTPDKHDPARDATTLPLIRAAIARGLPVLAICRGIQELNVALGGTLLQNVHDIPGRRDHRGGEGPLDVAYGPKHTVTVTGALARIVGADKLTVNSIHSQAIDRPGEGLVIEATADDDGTIEAVSAPGAPGFVLGLQWHPEWRCAEHPASVAIFRAFGDACRAHQQGLRKAA
jgi:putative glutamine amidotransferase